MGTRIQAFGLLVALGLLGMGAPSVVSADTTSVNASKVAPQRPTQQVRQDLRQARHRRGVIVEVPELSAGMAAQGLCLLLGATLIMNERRRRTS
jgi:hypothetical protein